VEKNIEVKCERRRTGFIALEFGAIDAGNFVSAGDGGFSLLFDERKIMEVAHNPFNGNRLLLCRGDWINVMVPEQATRLKRDSR
jgi:hypothetical protein